MIEILQLAFAFEIAVADRKSTRLNSSHLVISYAVFCLKKKKNMLANPHSELLCPRCSRSGFRMDTSPSHLRKDYRSLLRSSHSAVFSLEFTGWGVFSS